MLTRVAEHVLDIPKVATFDFRYGRFVEAPIRDWPRGYKELYLWGVMERYELRQWKCVVRPGDLVIDCGTNLGYWSLVASYLVGDKGLVVGFEAVADTYSRAQRNILASKRRNIVLKNEAVGDREGEVELFMAKDDEAGARASCAKGDELIWGGAIVAKMVRIDDQPEIQGRSVSLIKIDIEGGELAAILGARSLIARDRPVIAFEWNVITARAAGYSPNQIRILLEQWGYALWLCSPSGLKPFRERPDLSQWSPMVWALPGNRA